MYRIVYSVMRKNCHKQLSYVEIVGSITDREMRVVGIKSFEKNKGHATNLMICACRDYLTSRKRTDAKIYLDDCSDRFRCPHNLYTKLGMTYDDITGPEMTGSVRHIAALPINMSKNLKITHLTYPD